jgi:cytoskeletal protein CcmA (bactofilin family)
VQLGGTNHNESWTLNNLSEGCYFWRVQAVDHAFAGSPFSSEGTFTIGTPLAANAGSDQTINAGQSIQIGDSPVASGGTPPYSYSWSPASGLDDAAAENPNASPASTTTYTLTVTDANGCTATDEVTVEVISVKPFVFVANGLIEINRNKTSEGDIQSNYGDVQFDKGTPGTHTGNLFAGADIKIDKQNTIAGNATAGGEIHLSSGATITGSENPHTGIVVEALPNPSYSAGGPNETVKKNKSLTLPPGSYGNVVVCKNATLQLGHDGVSGEYFFNMLAAGEKSILAIDVSQGEVEINVVNKLDFGKQAEVDLSSGDAGSDDVTFTTLQESRLTIGEKARMLGNIIASDAAVTLAKNSRFKGKLWAQEIVVKQGAVFLPHGSSTPLPSITNTPDIEDIEAEQEITDAASLRITDYALAQNYPNPFNPSTKIGFLLPDAGNVTLKLYTITGQLVRTLASGNFSGGRHELVWDAKDDRGVQVSTGIYFYQIVVQRQNGDAPFMQTRRMILMK